MTKVSLTRVNKYFDLQSPKCFSNNTNRLSFNRTKHMLLGMSLKINLNYEAWVCSKVALH